ncbi:hypothetical protein M9H77_06333 [Catharanthus roseus]|uniref:Uncharacterized protein n=1 Tax=Catharanthus roseus TaxID=4058 RepID=A0ACC0BRU3_CATRO|nr:hypothetical protein M9H77_06333 [Catharanthus roseus]
MQEYRVGWVEPDPAQVTCSLYISSLSPLAALILEQPPLLTSLSSRVLHCYRSLRLLLHILVACSLAPCRLLSDARRRGSVVTPETAVGAFLPDPKALVTCLVVVAQPINIQNPGRVKYLLKNFVMHIAVSPCI